MVRTKLTVYEQVAAMIATGQLMRLAVYTSGLLSLFKGSTEPIFACSLCDRLPRPTPSLFELQIMLQRDAT